jgi:hypothetical protein
VFIAFKDEGSEGSPTGLFAHAERCVCPPVCGELLILTECTEEVQTCESFEGR